MVCENWPLTPTTAEEETAPAADWITSTTDDPTGAATPAARRPNTVTAVVVP